MSAGSEPRMGFGQFIDKLLWTAIVCIAAYGASQLQSASSSIAQLNEKMAVVVTKLSTQTDTLQDHEKRLRDLELKRESRFGN